MTDSSTIAALQKLRQYHLQNIADAADQIKEIDMEIAILRSQELEVDLIQAESGAA